jgi:hypothetical protein
LKGQEGEGVRYRGRQKRKSVVENGRLENKEGYKIQ